MGSGQPDPEGAVTGKEHRKHMVGGASRTEPQVTGQQDRNWESSTGCQKPGRSEKIQEAQCKAGQGKEFTLNSATEDMRASKDRLLYGRPKGMTEPGLRQSLSMKMIVPTSHCCSENEITPNKISFFNLLLLFIYIPRYLLRPS